MFFQYALQRLMENMPADVIAEIEQQLGVSIDGLDIRLLATRCPGEASGGNEQ